MASIERELREAFEDERRSVTTPGTLLPSVAARVRRWRIGALAGATVGTLGVVGLAAAIPLALTHGESPGIGPGASAGTDTIPNALGLSCGDPVPQPLLGSPDSTKIAVYETVVAMYPDDRSSLVTSPVDPDAHAAPVALYAVFKSAYPGAIIGRDGFVAGWTVVPPQFDSQMTVKSYPPDAPPTVTTFNSGLILWCPETRRGPDEVALPREGTYLVLPFVDPNAP